MVGTAEPVLVRGELGLSEIRPAWKGKAVIVIATGPSLTAEQVAVAQRLREADVVRVIAINDAYAFASFSDVHYFCDMKWWTWHRDRPAYQSFAGVRCTMRVVGEDKKKEVGCHVLQRGTDQGWSWRPDTLHTGKNSGHQCINLAALALGGADGTIITLGLDGRRTDRQHFFGSHPDNSEVPFTDMRSYLNAGAAELAARGLRVINCSPNSAIDCFERAEIETIAESLLLAA